MNAGLSNLITLKSWLLPAGLVAATTYDVQIAAIGKGVAAELERYCNRKFLRTVADTFECSADLRHQVLPRYPIEALTKIEIRYSLADGWADQGVISDLVWNIAEQAGLVTFPIRPGFNQARLRFTWTGGYFFETLEPTDGGYPTAVPSGSFALPADLILAWQLQCEHIWTQRDKLGLAIGKDVHSENARVIPSLAQIELLPTVRAKLVPLIRYAL